MSIIRDNFQRTHSSLEEDEEHSALQLLRHRNPGIQNFSYEEIRVAMQVLEEGERYNNLLAVIAKSCREKGGYNIGPEAKN